MKTLILIIAIIALALPGFAQFDTILTDGNNGKTFVIPNDTIPDYGIYKVGIENGGTIIFKLNNYVPGNCFFNGGMCTSGSDSLTSCGPRSYSITYAKIGNIPTNMEMKLNYFVNIIDSTAGSLTFSQTPDTIWINNASDSAILSVGTNFALNLWYKKGDANEFSSNNTVSVPSGIYVVGCSDGDYTSWDTITVAISCSDTIVINNQTICAGDSITVGSHYYKVTGTYYDTLTNAGGCDSIVTTNLIVNPLPTVNFGADSMFVQFANRPLTLDAGNNCTSYLWSSGETTQTIEAWNTGWYKVTVSNNCGSTSDSVYVEVITSTGNSELTTRNLSTFVDIYPNPASDFIKLSGYIPDNSIIEIYSLEGKLMIQILDFNTSNYIDVSMLPSGLYFIKVGPSLSKLIKVDPSF